MAGTCLETRGVRFGRLPFAAAMIGAALLAGVTAAQAQKITVWSGYPELEPFYRHVADDMKAKYPSLDVSIEAIPLREHEKRVALALASGENRALVIELGAASAGRYLTNDLLPKAPANVAAFVTNAANFTRFSASAPASTARSTARRCFTARWRCSTTSTCSRRRA